MPEFSQKSLDKLSTCHPDLQTLAEEAIKYVDFTVTWGYRGKEDQNKAYDGGFSSVRWPNSKHNHMTKKMVGDKLEMVPESLAFDFTPCPLDWNDTDRFCIFLGVFLALSKIMGIPIRLGPDVRKGDYGHIELEL